MESVVAFAAKTRGARTVVFLSANPELSMIEIAFSGVASAANCT